MSNLQKQIEKWLVNPEKFLSQPSLSRANILSENISEVFLNLESLTCIRKNELSADEIVILSFWITPQGENAVIEGIIRTRSNYKDVGEQYELNMSIPMIPMVDGAVFCFMVYEEDMPVLLDPHDPIGMVAFHQNGSISIYAGDFRQIETPLTYPFNFKSSQEIELDANSDGCYRLKYCLSKIEN